VRTDERKENPVSVNTPPVPAPPGDFASGERTAPLAQEDVREEGFQGDFAAGERTETPTPEEVRSESLHGDYSAGERTEPLAVEGETPGTFGDTGG
jgi:hypothetical protein